MISIEDSFYRCARTLDLSVAEIRNEFIYEMSMAECTGTVPEYLSTSFFCESSDDGSKKGFLSKVIEAIKTFISKCLDSIHNLFSEKEDIDLYKFLSSRTGKQKLSYDITKMKSEIDKELSTGRKLIVKIGRSGAVADSEIDKFCDKAAKIFEKISFVSIPGSQIRKYGENVIQDGLRDVSKTLDSIARECAVPKWAISDLKNTSSNVKREVVNTKTAAQINRVTNSITKCVKEYGDKSMAVEKEIKQIMDGYRKEMEVEKNKQKEG